MPDHPDNRLKFATRLSHVGRPGVREHTYVNPPITRGSTLLNPDVATYHADQGIKRAPGYGTGGNATHHALEDMVIEIEGGARCQITSTGLSAVTIALLAFLSAGDHILVVDSAYGPTRRFCDGMLRRFGVTTTYYPPTIDADGLAALIQPKTRMVFLESPGSHTFEVQDVPTLAEVARSRGLKVLMDNTWGAHFFQPFKHGVDVSIQALTKYVSGHSDLVLGAITTATEADYVKIRIATRELGECAGPDDCWLALRGARTFLLRLHHQMQAGLTVAAWLAERAEVAKVLHPGLPGAPGHALWKRDYTGASSLFGVVLQSHYTAQAMVDMIDGMKLFGIGASWGGFESLIVPTTGTITRTIPCTISCTISSGANDPAPGHPAFRVHIGLEDTDDLIADLAAGLASLRRE